MQVAMQFVKLCLSFLELFLFFVAPIILKITPE